MTIFALSSGPGVSGVAIVRISGLKLQMLSNLLLAKKFPS